MNKILKLIEHYNYIALNESDNYKKKDRASDLLISTFEEFIKDSNSKKELFNYLVNDNNAISARGLILFLREDDYRNIALEKLKLIRNRSEDNHASSIAKLALYAWE